MATSRIPPRQRGERHEPGERTRRALASEARRRLALARAVFRRPEVQAHIADVRRRAALPAGGFTTGPGVYEERAAWMDMACRIEGEQERKIEVRFAYECAELRAFEARRVAELGEAWAFGCVRLAKREPGGPYKALLDGAEALCTLAGLDLSWYGWALDAIQQDAAALNEASVEPYEPVETHAEDSELGRPHIAIHDEMTEEGLLHHFRALRAWQQLPQSRPEPLTKADTQGRWTPERYKDCLRRIDAFARQAPPPGRPARRGPVDEEEIALLRALAGQHVPGEVGLRRLARTAQARRYFAMKGLADATADAKQRALFNGLKKLAALDEEQSVHT